MTQTPASNGLPTPSRKSLREQLDASTRGDASTASVALPLVEHVPAVDVPVTGAPKVKRSVGKRIAAVTAVAAIACLTLPFALPFVQQPVAADAAAVNPMTDIADPADQQQLFSEVSVDDMPIAFTEIVATPVEDDKPTDYKTDKKVLVNYPFSVPVTLTDGFGYRTAPVAQFHDAQDFAAGAGTPILAIADGEVLEAGFADDGCGFGLKLEHEIDDKTVTSRYCHMEMESHSLAVGDEVKMGDQVGTVGNTGMSFGPHLHLAIRVDDEPVDPMPFLAEYSKVKRK
ncbi:MAG: M23 family metallopeptidase [Leucobacter sp.]